MKGSIQAHELSIWSSTWRCYSGRLWKCWKWHKARGNRSLETVGSSRPWSSVSLPSPRTPAAMMACSLHHRNVGESDHEWNHPEPWAKIKAFCFKWVGIWPESHKAINRDMRLKKNHFTPKCYTCHHFEWLTNSWLNLFCKKIWSYFSETGEWIVVTKHHWYVSKKKKNPKNINKITINK